MNTMLNMNQSLSSKSIVSAQHKDFLHALELQLSHALIALLHEIGVGGLLSQGQSLESIVDELNIDKRYEAWLAVTLDKLRDCDWVNLSAAEVVEANEQWLQFITDDSNQANYPAQLALVRVTTERMSRILTGQCLATEVIFPGGSTELLDGIYKNNHQADYFNSVLVDDLIKYVRELTGQYGVNNVRILEIGAGTGGTTSQVIQALQPFSDVIERYCFTDISNSFFPFAKDRFGEQAPYLTFERLDIGRTPTSQGADIGGYDVVIASNVLHATADVQRALKHAKSLLQQDGLLLLNEISTFTLYNHVTFGLLEGWWLHTDSHLRLTGCPALAPNKWQILLEELGYQGVAFPAESMHDIGQQVIAARSDGFVEQALLLSHGENDHHEPARPTDDARRVLPIDINLNAVIVDTLTALLDIDAASINPNDPFQDFGVDSINGVSLVQRLNDELSIELEAISLFDYPTVTKLAEHIRTEFAADLANDSTAQLINATLTAEHLPEPSLSQPVLPNNTHGRKPKPVEPALIEMLAEVLSLPVDKINAKESFRDMGLDSINGVGFVEAINERFNIEMEAISLFDYPTIGELSNYIGQAFDVNAAFDETLVNRTLANSAPQINTATSELLSDSQSVAKLSQVKSFKNDAAKNNDAVKNKAPKQNDSALGSVAPMDTSTQRSGQASTLATLAQESPVEGSEQAYEDIAIIGMSGRFPGSDTLDQFWAHLRDGDDLVTESTRWDLRHHFRSRLPDGPTYCTRAGFLNDIDAFDNEFFNISAVEARNMDPQQRLFLEQAWLAMEDASCFSELGGLRSGVYVGCTAGDYNRLLPQKAAAQAFWGNASSILASRIAYVLNLKGPAVAIDTACSSSLVAVHMACQSLRQHEIDLAITGGVFVQSTPEFHVLSNRAGMLSPDGKCHTFDSRANGFVPGEGAGAIVLKRLSTAIRDADNILGVIKGSAMNQDGASNGITAPSALSQEALQKEVYERFGIDPASIQMLEAHGTGTQLGDPIEFKALNRSFSAATNKQHFCAIGSVKTNIGHTATAAGVAGILKILLSIKHQTIPKTLHFEEGNSNIQFANSPFYVSTQTEPWNPNAQGPRRAAISSYGFSGTNVHMVIDEASVARSAAPVETLQRSMSSSSKLNNSEPNKNNIPSLVTVSAKSAEQLKQSVVNLRHWCIKQAPANNKSASIHDVALNLMFGRMHHRHRFACVAESLEELSGKLAGFLHEQAAGVSMPISADVLSQAKSDWVQTHSQNTVDRRHNLDIMASAYVHNEDLDFNALFVAFKHQKYQKISLPGYAFAKTRFWPKGATLRQQPMLDTQTIDDDQPVNVHHKKRHGFEFVTSQRADDGTFELTTQIDLSSPEHQYLKDHVVGSAIWFPAAAIFEIVLQACQRWPELQPSLAHCALALEQIQLNRAVVFTADQRLAMKVSLRVNDGPEPSRSFTLSSARHFDESATWSLHAQGAISLNGDVSIGGVNTREDKKSAENSSRVLNKFRDACQTHEPAERIYRQFKRQGLHYGAAFRTILEGWRGERSSLIKLVSDDAREQDFMVNPAQLDGALQSVLLASPIQSQNQNQAQNQTDVTASTAFKYGDSMNASNSLNNIAVPTGLGSLSYSQACLAGSMAAPKWALCTLTEERDDVSTYDLLLLDQNAELILNIHGLTIKRLKSDATQLAKISQETNENDQADLHNQPLIKIIEWKPQIDAVFDVPVTGSAEHWWVFEDNIGTAAAVITELDSGSLVRVKVGRQFTQHDARSYSVNPESEDDWRAFFDTIKGQPWPSQLVYCWGLNATPIRSAEQLQQNSALNGTGLVSFIQAFEQQRGAERYPCMTLVTRGTQPVQSSQDVTNPQQALLWGFGASLSLEMPDFRCRLLDLDPAAPSSRQESQQLLKTLISSSITSEADEGVSAERKFENRVALRRSSETSGSVYSTWVPRLRHADEIAGAIVNAGLQSGANADVNNHQFNGQEQQQEQLELTIDTHAAYIVTGGLGALGWGIVQRLIDEGVTTIFSLSRSRPSPEQQQQIAEYKQRGVSLHAVAIDLTDPESCVAGFAHIQDLYDASNWTLSDHLTTVIHLAGVLNDGVIQNLKPEQIHPVLNAKIAGLHALHDRFPSIKQYVLFSSIAGALGSPGQAAYAAANAYLDAWAHQKTSQGLSVTSINWGPWNEGGMATRALENRANIKRRGLDTLSVETGQQTFVQLLALLQHDARHNTQGRQESADEPESTSLNKAQLMPANFDVIGSELFKALPLFSDLMHDRESTSATASSSPSSALASRIYALGDADQQRAELNAYLAKTVATIIEHDNVPHSRTLKELGMDSLMLLDLNNAINQDLGLRVTSTELLPLGSIEEIGAFLQTTLSEQDVHATDTPAGPLKTVPDVAQTEYRVATRDVVRLVRTEQMGTPSAAHNIGLAARLLTPITHAQLNAFLIGLSNQHAAFRTAIVPARNGSGELELVTQRQLDSAALKRMIRVTQLAQGASLEQHSQRRLSALMKTDFDLSQASLWRFELIESASGEQALLFGAHHGVSDFQSLLLFMSDLDAFLETGQVKQGTSNRDVDLLISSQHVDQPVQSWENAFTGCQRLNLFLSNTRPEKPSYRQGIQTLNVPTTLVNRIIERSKDIGVTPAAFCLGSFIILLARLAQQNRFVVAVPVDTRIQSGALDAYGFFGVPVPLPCEAQLSASVVEVMQQVDQRFTRVLQKGAAISDTVSEMVSEGLYEADAPLVEAYFNYIRPGFDVKHLQPLGTAPALFDVDLMIIFSAALGTVSVYHNLDLIDEAAAQSLATAYVNCLESNVNEQQNMRVSDDFFGRQLTKLNAVTQNVSATEKATLMPHSSGTQTAELGHPHKTIEPHASHSESAELNSTQPENKTPSETPTTSVHLGLAATFSMGRLGELFQVVGKKEGLIYDVKEAAYHQVLAGILDPGSALNSHGLNAAVIAFRSVDLLKYSGCGIAQLEALTLEYREAFLSFDRRAPVRPIIYFAPTDPKHPHWVQCRDLDAQLADYLRAHSNVIVLDSQDTEAHYPVQTVYDTTTDELGHLPFTAEFQAAMALTICDVLPTNQRPLIKVIAVDGDNTLWGGVAGELEPQNVELGGAYQTFAQRLLRLREQGVLLVLISQNDEATLLEVLSRPNSTLKPEHFIIISHGWNEKTSRIADCANTLNLGLNSVLFIDDNPNEIAKMRLGEPQVSLQTFPQSADRITELVSNFWAFERTQASTKEDGQRAEFYAKEQRRQTLKKDYSSFDEYIKQLQLNITFELMNKQNAERILQLSARTNQFNLHARPLREDAIQRLLRSGGEIWVAHVKDRFGDYGQVCVLAITKQDSTLDVSDWMLSCRVLGRGVELKILAWLVATAKRQNCERIRIGATLSKRNQPARHVVSAMLGCDVNLPEMNGTATLQHVANISLADLANQG